LGSGCSPAFFLCATTQQGEINMRRLVGISGISNKKFKAIATLVVVIFLLISLHVAAEARMATLKRQLAEQEKLQNLQPSVPQGSTDASSTPKQVTALTNAKVEEASANQPEKQTLAQPAAGDHQIIISIPDRQLAILENGQVLKIYAIAVGSSATPSPDGDFVVINHAKDPTYRHGDMEIGPGKDNPLGSRWMGLSLKGYGIHGTNVQSSVGKAVSHGCFRMRKHDVEELYSMVQVGDTVTVRRERDAMIAKVFVDPIAVPVNNNTLVAAEQTGAGELAADAAETATIETTQQ
jgi:lipoprotein-anchoring transpeptidase ErfK/SrfK